MHATPDPILSRPASIDCLFLIKAIRDRRPRPLLTLIEASPGAHMRLNLQLGQALIGQQSGGHTPDLQGYRKPERG